MLKKDKSVDPDTHFRILSIVEDNPSTNQRSLAKELGLSLGSVNFLLHELIKVGHIKIQNFNQNKKKLSYLYLLTPKGITQKSHLAKDFLSRKIEEYEKLKSEIEKVKDLIN